MTIERLDRIAEIEADHFWFSARRRIVHDALRRLPLRENPTIVDVGCGTGAALRDLPIAASRIGVDALDERLGRSPADDSAGFLRGDITALPLRTDHADVVLALDVIEHVDDRAALAEIGRILRPHGHLVLTVPAGPRLWSVRDDEAGHLRRYTRASIRTVLQTTGFSVTRCSAFHGALLPLLVVNRIARRRSTAARDREDHPGPALNRVLSAITGAEASLAERGIRPPLGSSLIVVAEIAR